MNLALSPMRHSVSFVVPFYNEAESLPRLIDELAAFIRACRRPVRFSAIFIDDGSTDGSSSILRFCAKQRLPDVNVRLIRLSRNFGKEIALTAGLNSADTDAVVLLDADLQHPVEVVEQFLHGWLEESYDVVYGYRETRPGLIKRLAIALYYRLVNVDGAAAIPADAGDFRLLSRRAYQALRQVTERQRFMKGLYSWIGFPQKAVAFAPPKRRFGKTKYSALRLWLLGLDGITSFSILPLRLAAMTGISVAVLAAGYGLWSIFVKYYYGVDPAGYPTLVVSIAFIGAVQLIFLGIIGEYIGKILLEVKQRPLFIVEADEVLPASEPAGIHEANTGAR